MAFSTLNATCFIGNSCGDPAYYAPKKEGGQPVATFSVAINERRRNGADWENADPTFVPVVCYGVCADRANQSIAKGTKVCVQGALRMDSWNEKETGKRREKLTVVAERLFILDRAKDTKETLGERTEGLLDGSTEKVLAGVGAGEDENPF